jgi:hypothetical protein
LKIRGTVPQEKFNTWMIQVKPKPKYSFFSWLNIPTPSSFSCLPTSRWRFFFFLIKVAWGQIINFLMVDKLCDGFFHLLNLKE